MTAAIPAEHLARVRIPAAPLDFSGTRDAFIARHLDPVLPSVEAVGAFHRLLVQYLEGRDAVYLVRQVSGMERGEVVPTDDGTMLMPTDNSPAWWWHAVLFNGIPLDADLFAALVRETPSHMFRIPRVPTANGAGWYVAHLLNAKDGDTAWRHWTRETAAKRFVRNIHPCNVFFVPKWTGEWKRVGEDPLMIRQVAAHYRARYGTIWAEFMEMARAPLDFGHRALDGPLDVQRAAFSATPVAGPAIDHRPLRAGRATGRVGAPGWPEVLRPGRIPPVGELLARHPDAPDLTRALLSGLTVPRLVAIADALHNKCRPPEMAALAPGDPIAQARHAWAALAAGADKVYVRPSGWTGAIELLRDGEADGLERVARLDIRALARVGANIVSGPYDWSTANRVR